MQLGIFAKTFSRPTLEGVLDAVVIHGFKNLQFGFTCAGLPAMPDRIEPDLLGRIRHALDQRKLQAVAVSGTFNMIHPDPGQRRDGLRRLRVLAGACRQLRIPVISLCTGTRDPQNMWRAHPGNQAPEAWRDLGASMREALKIAAEFGVTLGVEPEVANVVDSAIKARRLLDEQQSPHLKIIFDGANLFPAGTLPRMREILQEAVRLLSTDIVIAHAKDLDHDGEAGHLAAGKGLLDYDFYLGLLRQAGFRGPLLLHGLAETEATECARFLKAKLGK